MFGVQWIHNFEQHFPENFRHCEPVSRKLFWRAVLLHRQNRPVKSLGKLEHQVADLPGNCSVFYHFDGLSRRF